MPKVIRFLEGCELSKCFYDLLKANYMETCRPVSALFSLFEGVTCEKPIRTINTSYNFLVVILLNA